jgi:hypothetical protein
MRRLLPIVVLAALALASAAYAAPITYVATLSGSAESPPNNSPGTGSAEVIYDPVAHILSYDVIFSDLLAPTTAAHIHCCTTTPFTGTAGVATTTPSFPGFPLGVQNGVFVNTFDLTLASSWNPAFITASGGTVAGAEAAFASGLASGRTYFNIHTAAPNGFPGGEIRGFLVAPEPGTAALLLLGAVGLVVARRRARA